MRKKKKGTNKTFKFLRLPDALPGPIAAAYKSQARGKDN